MEALEKKRELVLLGIKCLMEVMRLPAAQHTGFERGYITTLMMHAASFHIGERNAARKKISKLINEGKKEEKKQRGLLL